MTTELFINGVPSTFDSKLFQHLPEIKQKICMDHYDDIDIECAIDHYKYVLFRAYRIERSRVIDLRYSFIQIFSILVSIAFELNDHILIDNIVYELGYYLVDYDIDDAATIESAKRLINHPHFFESCSINEDDYYTLPMIMSCDKLKEFIIDTLNNHTKGIYYCYRIRKLSGDTKIFDDTKLNIKWSPIIKDYILS